MSSFFRSRSPAFSFIHSYNVRPRCLHVDVRRRMPSPVHAAEKVTTCTDEKEGVVYLVRAARYDRVKAGYWTSSLARLRSRYATAYGFDLTMFWYPTLHPRRLEKMFMDDFAERRVSAELFDAAFLPEYRSYLRARSFRDVEFHIVGDGSQTRMGRRTKRKACVHPVSLEDTPLA